MTTETYRLSLHIQCEPISSNILDQMNLALSSIPFTSVEDGISKVKAIFQEAAVAYCHENARTFIRAAYKLPVGTAAKNR